MSKARREQLPLPIEYPPVTLTEAECLALWRARCGFFLTFEDQGYLGAVLDRAQRVPELAA